MKVYLKNGEFLTEDFLKKTSDNVIGLEEAARTTPKKSLKYPIGYVIPLGTLGNAPNQSVQFKSNFHIVAYIIASDLIDRDLDFEDFNLADRVQDKGQISKLSKALDELAESKLGKGWRITIFNVNLDTVVSSMCKGNNDLDTMRKSMDDLYTIVNSRILQLGKSTAQEPWGHELIDLFYAPLKAVSAEFSKIIKPQATQQPKPKLSRAQELTTKEAKKKLTLNKICEGILIEALVYDDYANGMRLLTNIESFASSKIRIHKLDNSDIYLFVLKARISGDNPEFLPIRQFAGKSKISDTEITSGCVTRIIYNLINKNYAHWSFISIPDDLKVSLLTLS